MSDETHFRINGEVYKQNGRYWAANNPRQIRRRPLHPPRVTVGMLFHRSPLWARTFFWKWEWWSGNSNGWSLHKRATQPPAAVSGSGILRATLASTRRGYMPHHHYKYGRLARSVFRQANLPIRFGDVLRPAGSPNLPANDFSSCGYLKSRVFAYRPEMLYWRWEPARK